MKYTITIFLAVLFFNCTSEKKTIRSQSVGNAFGTSYSIIYLSDSPLDFQKEIDSVIDVVNQSMSTYLPDSDISRINNGDATIKVDEMFKEVFRISSDVHRASKGYFDPTIGVLANAWGFGPGEQIALDSVKVDSLLNYVGWNKVTLLENGTIQKEHPEIRFDFNAVAKGYAIDRLGAMLDEKEIVNYLVEVGGEVLAKGTNIIKQKPWTVGIDRPNAFMKRGTAAVINLEDKALASSGNYRKFRYDEETGEKYVHTIDPLTGFTKNAKVLAASVVANDCATADAFATAFMAMDLEESKNVLRKRKDLNAYIIYIGQNDTIKAHLTPGFEKLLK
ncbi:FAD:protein FMN transferase [uncultured Croceitalea sp.]|uniref:FAD:protein FMN transferase n=1 Tax=uncultured Croceitalea sp. TaxID=1798908 RepID=UPI003306400C